MFTVSAVAYPAVFLEHVSTISIPIVPFVTYSFLEATRYSPSISADGQKILVPSFSSESGADSLRIGGILYDRSTRTSTPVLAPRNDGTLSDAVRLALLSADGQVVFGRNADGSLFRWTLQDGATLLLDSNNVPVQAIATGVTADGSRMIGTRANSLYTGPLLDQGVTWSTGTGFVQPLTVDLVTSDNSMRTVPVSGVALSDDGSTMAVSSSKFFALGFADESFVSPGVLNVFANWWTGDFSRDGSSFAYRNSSGRNRLLTDGVWQNIPVIPLSISQDGENVLGWREFLSSGPSSLRLFVNDHGTIYPTISGFESASFLLEDLGFGEVLEPYQGIAFVADQAEDNKTFLLAASRYDDANGNIEYAYFVARVPEVGSFQIVMGTVFIAAACRWIRTFALSRTRQAVSLSQP
jgi:hypothetical protein